MRVSFICINNLAKAAVSHISVGLGRVDTFHQLATHLTAKSFSLFPWIFFGGSNREWSFIFTSLKSDFLAFENPSFAIQFELSKSVAALNISLWLFQMNSHMSECGAYLYSNILL